MGNYLFLRVIGIIRAIIIVVTATIIALIAIVLSPFDSKGKIAFFLSKIFSKIILSVSGIKLEVEGKENLTPDKEYIFISNHISYLDIPVLMQAIPKNLRFIYKKSMNKIPIFGWAMYLSKYIPIDRENGREAMKSLKKAAELTDNGISIVIFPEGTRSEDGNIGEFKRGFTVLADEAKKDIVPILIIGTDKILSRDSLNIKSGIATIKIFPVIKYTKDKKMFDGIRELLKSEIENNKSKSVN